MNLQIKRYADDLKLLHPETKLTENPEHVSLDLSGVTVVVVDDVMYRGTPCYVPWNIWPARMPMKSARSCWWIECHQDACAQ